MFVLLLPLWYLKVKVLLIIFDITCAHNWINPNSVRVRLNAVTQDKNYLALVLYYYDVNNQSFLLWWLASNTYPSFKTVGKLRWFLLLHAGTITTIFFTTESPSLRKATNYGIVEAKERVFIQLEGVQFKIIFVGYYWSAIQPSNLWSIPLYYVISKQLTASEAIRVSKPYTTSKANYQTVFGFRTSFTYLLFHNTIKVTINCHNATLIKAPIETVTIRTP